MGYGPTLGERLEEAQRYVEQVNRANGWYDEERTFPVDIALLHSEVSEAFEGWRKGDDRNVAEELADVFVRLLDTCSRNNVDLAAEFYAKMSANEKRGYRHGGKAV